MSLTAFLEKLKNTPNAITFQETIAVIEAHYDFEPTLACFGAFYTEDVLKNPDGTDHQNIRNFMKTGWDGIAFYGEPLTLKQQ